MIRANIKETNLNFAPLNNRSATNLIVIHHTGNPQDDDLSAVEIHRSHLAQGWAGIGYHFVIRKDGSIERGRPVNTIGSHAYGRNSDSIGIHICGNFESADPQTFRIGSPTDAQIESAAMLIANLTADYNIPCDRKHIVGHCELMATACPGKNLFARLDEISGKANWYRFNSRPEAPDKPVKQINPSGDMLSEHFGKNEFWCRGQEQGTCHCNHSCKVNPRLLELLEQLRKNIGGRAIFINSGYRCPDHNSSPAVGGARFSQHTAGNAADIAVPSGLSFGEFKWYVEQLPFDGIGLYKRGEYDGWIHVDVRDGGIGSKIYWEG